MENISIDTVNYPLQPEVCTLRVKGFLYANTLVHFDKTFQSVIAASKKKFILDLAETNHISSGGWSILIVSLQQVKKWGGDILLAAMNPEVRDSFELLEYDKVLRLFATVEEALKEGFNIVPGNPAEATPAPSLSGLS